MCFLVALNSFAFSYSMVVATLGVVILPSEAIHLFSEQHAMMLGVMLGCTGVTQLLGPAVGYGGGQELLEARQVWLLGSSWRPSNS